MQQDFFSENSYRALSEISGAVEKAFKETGLGKTVSDDGATPLLPGVKKYIALVITSFIGGEKAIEVYNSWMAFFGERIVVSHMGELATNVHVGDTALVRSLAKRGSKDELAAVAAVGYGTAAGVLKRLGQEHRTFSYMSARARPIVESMEVVGQELDLIPKNNAEFRSLSLDHYVSNPFNKN